MSEDSQIVTQVFYKKGDSLYPNYRLTRIIQQTGGQHQQFTIGTGSSVESIFEIPVKAFNFAQSYTAFSITPPAIANNSTWFFTDTMSPFLQVQAYTRSGIYLCNLNYCSNYTKVKA